MLEGIGARTEMVMDVNQVGDARVENLENLVCARVIPGTQTEK